MHPYGSETAVYQREVEMKRLDNETYEEYKARMKEYNRIMSIDFNRKF